MKQIAFFLIIFSALVLFRAESKAQNLVLNGDLENWIDNNTPSDWSLYENISKESGMIHGGLYSARHTSDPATKKFQQNISGITAGTMYTISYWYYDNDLAARTRIWCYWLSGSSTLPDNQAELRPDIYSIDSAAWILVTYTLTAPATADGFRFEVRVYKQDNVPGGSVFYDDFSMTTGGTPLPEPTNYPTDLFAQANNLSISLIWTDAEGGQLPQNYLIKASEANDIVAPVDGIPEADDLDFTDGKGVKNVAQGIQTFTFNNLKADQQYFFKIYPYTNGGTLIDYKTDGTPPSATATTADIIMILYKDFEDQLFDPWDTISLASDKGWIISSYAGNYYAYVNGYLATEACDEWLISPSMNLDLYTNETLTFMTASNYTGPVLEVKVSNNYITGANPATATWTLLNANLSPGSWTWTPSGNVDLSGVPGNNVHLAFHYISTLTEAAAWEVDDIIITGVLIEGMNDPGSRSEPVQLSPNPAIDKFSLNFAQSGKKEVSITTLTGNTVYNGSTDQSTLLVPVNKLSKGIYFVRIQYPESNQFITKKLIVR